MPAITHYPHPGPYREENAGRNSASPQFVGEAIISAANTAHTIQENPKEPAFFYYPGGFFGPRVLNAGTVLVILALRLEHLVQVTQTKVSPVVRYSPCLKSARLPAHVLTARKALAAFVLILGR